MFYNHPANARVFLFPARLCQLDAQDEYRADRRVCLIPDAELRTERMPIGRIAVKTCRFRIKFADPDLVTWTQEETDRTIAEYECILEEIGRSVLCGLPR